MKKFKKKILKLYKFIPFSFYKNNKFNLVVEHLTEILKIIKEEEDFQDRVKNE